MEETNKEVTTGNPTDTTDSNNAEENKEESNNEVTVPETPVSHISTDLTQATSYDALEQMVADAQALNGDMAGLKQTLNQAEIAQGTQNHADSDAQIRADFDQVILDAQDKLVLNILDSEVTSAKQAILDAQAKLNGIQKLKEAKAGAIKAVSDLANMIQEQKQASIDQISAAQTLSQATAAWATAQSLNTELGKLTKAIDSATATQKLVSYLEADSDKKTSLDQALTAANSVRVGMDVSAVTDALNLVLNAQADLNGVTNLANKKAEVNQAIEQLTSLNQAQKQEFKNQVVAIDKSSNLAAISTQASDLNAEMGKLIKAVADAEASYATVNYKEADQDKQAALTKAVEAGKIATDFEKGQAIDDAGINDLIASIVAEQIGLNSQSNLDQAKKEAINAIDSLTNLSDSQKKHSQSMVDQAVSRADVAKAKGDAISLDDAADKATEAIDFANETIETENYTMADFDRQAEVNQALNKAKSIRFSGCS